MSRMGESIVEEFRIKGMDSVGGGSLVQMVQGLAYQME